MATTYNRLQTEYDRQGPPDPPEASRAVDAIDSLRDARDAFNRAWLAAAASIESARDAGVTWDDNDAAVTALAEMSAATFAAQDYIDGLSRGFEWQYGPLSDDGGED